MFIVDLWDSVLTPGTSPALIQATHASFILLILSLSSLIWLTKSIHFINLLIIAILLYGTVIWFIGELRSVKLRSNAELERESNAIKAAQVKDEDIVEVKEAGSSGIAQLTPVKSRKA